MSNPRGSTPFAEKILANGLIWLIVLLPFQTLLTVALVSKLGHLYLITAWKEVVLLGLGVVAVYWIARHAKSIHLFELPLLVLTAAYVLLHIGHILLHGYSFAGLISMAINLRFLCVFWIAWIIACMTPLSYAGLLLKRTILLGLGVTLIGILLVTALPRNTLESFGYDPPAVMTPGIPPAYQTIGNSSIVRAQSTLRGPNALGAYLVLPFTFALFSLGSRKKRYVGSGALLLLADGLFLTHSRSAWIAVAAASVLWLFTTQQEWLRRHVAVFVAGVAACIIVFAGLLNIGTFRQLLLHETSPNTGVISSNQGHLEAFQAGAKDVWSHPLGQGLGTAGPASALVGPAKISENYFLQIGQELGWLGLLLIVVIHGYVGMLLWRNRKSPYVMPVFAAFVGLSITNLLLHTWTDETVAITFWAVAGLVLGNTYRSDIIKQSTNPRTFSR